VASHDFWPGNRAGPFSKEGKSEEKRTSQEAHDVKKQAIYTVPKSTNESRAQYCSEPERGHTPCIYLSQTFSFNFTFLPGRVLRSVCLYVCLSTQISLNHTSKLHKIFCTCYPWPWQQCIVILFFALYKYTYLLTYFIQDNSDELVPEKTFTYLLPIFVGITQYLLIKFLHLLWSITSSLCTWRISQSFFTILQVLFIVPLCLTPFTSLSMHFHPNHSHPLFKHVRTILKYFAIILQLHDLFLAPFSTHYTWTCYFNAKHPHNHSISAHSSANSLSFFTGHVSLPCNTQLRAQFLCNVPLIKERGSCW